MKKVTFKIILITCLLIISTTSLCGCWFSKSEEPVSVNPADASTPKDFKSLRVDESGRIPIVMFHRFVDTFTGTSQDDKQYTTTFEAFKKLLPELYNQHFRLISLSDYTSGNINVPIGFKPMVFTFDDCTPGQFSLVEQNGVLTASSDSAVGILKEFSKAHPDFGAKGTFFINLANNPFSGGSGTLQQKLKYLVDNGFEIGNHTLTQVDMNTLKTRVEVERELGGNQKKLYDFMPGYMMQSLALPLGSHPRNIFAQNALSGIYEGVEYKNKIVLEVGWDPAISPFAVDFDPTQVHRIRAPGITSVSYDLTWWLKELKRSSIAYISDGNPETVTIPEKKLEVVDESKLQGKTLVTY